MTTLYKPVLIETAEQAEKLPDGTVAIDRPQGTGIPEASVKTGGGKWMGTLDGDRPYDCAAMIGDYALVPIEAEEETRLHIVRSGARTTTADLTRLVTSWEAVS